MSMSMSAPKPMSASTSSWRVRDAADSLLARRGLRSTSILDGDTDQEHENENNIAPEMTLSKYFDVDSCQARLRRDKTPIVRMALDAAASALLENLHKADDDESEHEDTYMSSVGDQRLPSLLEDVVKLQDMRVESMERAHCNKDLAKRKIAVAKEQERDRMRQAKSGKTTPQSQSGSESSPPSAIEGTAGAKPDAPAPMPKPNVKRENNSASPTGVVSSALVAGMISENIEANDTTSASGPTLSIKLEDGAPKPNPSASTTANSNATSISNSNSTASPRKGTNEPTLASPPKFTRNTPASSASALEARLTASRAILCTAANVTFDLLTPALAIDIDVADVPQNPANSNSNSNSNDDSGMGGSHVRSDGSVTKTATATVPNMGPVIIEAQMLGKRIENVATNAIRRSRRRFRFRKDTIRFQNDSSSSSNILPETGLLCTSSSSSSSSGRGSGFRILENPFAWNDADDDHNSESSCPMEVDETVSVVTAENSSIMDDSNERQSPSESENWGKVCIPRLLSILQKGTGNAIIHDVLWSTRYGRISNLLHEISMMAEDNISVDGIGRLHEIKPDRNFGPHLIVTVGPDVDRFVKEFKAPNSHLRLMSTVDETQLRALPYKGSKVERRRLRLQFSHATGLPEASFHVVVTSYADFLTDYIHFCQTPFEVVILDDGVSWMAAAHNDPNSPIATVWEDAMFSKNDHQMGLAGTTPKEWDYGADTETIGEDILREAFIGLTAKHRLITASKLRVENPRSPSDLLPVSGLLSFALPHFADVVREEWDRSRIGNDSASMSHFRKLLTRSLVVHDPGSSTSNSTLSAVNVKREDNRPELPSSSSSSSSSNIIYELAMKTLKGDMPEPIRCQDVPEVPEEISDEEFIADGKVASSRRSALQWLGPLEDSWLRYELGTVSFEPILAAMKFSLWHGHICEEITTAASMTTGYTGQIIGNLAFKLGVRSGKSFGSGQGLRQHNSTHHAPPGIWLCRTCKVDCVTSQARTHHERSCGQPSSAGGSGSSNDVSAATSASKKDIGKKKGKAAKAGTSAVAKEEKDADGSVRVPSYRGVWVDQAGKYFIKIGSERVSGEDGKKTPLIFESIVEAAKKYDALVKRKVKGDATTQIECNFKPNGTRIVYEDVPAASTTGLGGSVVPALSVINIKDLPPDVKPLLRDPRQTSRTGGNSKRHVYAYRGVCRQARKGHDRWQSQISFLGVNHYLGTFDSEWDAAAIYAWAHLILYGEEATRQAQKEGEEAAAAYEQEKKDIAAGKIPAAPPKADKKAKQTSEKKTGDKPGATKKWKKGVKRGDKPVVQKRKPGRPKKKPEEVSTKRLKMATGKDDITSILAMSVGKATILAPVSKFAEMSDEEMAREAAVRIVAARSVNYCITEVPLPAPIHMNFRPCVPRSKGSHRHHLTARSFPSEDQIGGGALLVGLDPSMFGWNIDSIVSKQYFGSVGERRNATAALTEEFGEDGLNQQFRSLVTGGTTVIGCASSRMKRVYSSLGMGSPPMGGPIGAIDCNTGGNSKCCSETAACIRYVPTETGDFQLSALTSDLITMNGQRITPEMGNFPLFNEDICTIGSRVFLFLLPSDT